MTFDELDPVAPCLFPTSPVENVPCGTIPATPIGLEIVPASASVETGGEFPFIAVADMSDGTKVIVTTDSTWWVSDESVAEIGEHTGISGSLLEPPLAGGFNEDTVTVYASYGGIQAEASLRCFSICSSVALDVVLVLDRSASMAQVGSSGKSRIELVTDAAQYIIDNASTVKDRIAIVSYAGNIWMNSTAVDHTEKESTLDHPLSNDKTALGNALDSLYAIRGDCSASSPMQCQTGIGGGLEDALAELKSSRHRAEAQRVIILFTDGAENIDNPIPELVAEDAKNNYDVIIVTVGLKVPSTFQARLNGLATPTKAYNLSKAEDVIGIFSTISHVLCMAGDPYYGYEYGLPGSGFPILDAGAPTDLPIMIAVGYFPYPKDDAHPADIPMSAAEIAYAESLLDAQVATSRADMEDASVHSNPTYAFVSQTATAYIFGYFDTSWGYISATEHRNLAAETVGDFEHPFSLPYGWTAYRTVWYHPTQH